jgi:hypothetical protein
MSSREYLRSPTVQNSRLVKEATNNAMREVYKSMGGDLTNLVPLDVEGRTLDELTEYWQDRVNVLKEDQKRLALRAVAIERSVVARSLVKLEAENLINSLETFEREGILDYFVSENDEIRYKLYRLLYGEASAYVGAGAAIPSEDNQ